MKLNANYPKSSKSYRRRKTLLLFIVWFIPTFLFAQENLITGTVSDQQGKRISGVSVLLKGSNKATSTDADGSFKISIAAPKTVIIFRSLGYKTQEQEANPGDILTISMEADASNLDEVVVVGYGTRKKINLTGAVDQISGKQLESRPVTNIMQGLQGASPGLNITYGNGSPGSIPNINIRGTGSINGGSPLIVIDGIPAADSWDMLRLSPNDIATYTVLRDAASAAIYGARATYGVILITTKSGQQGRQVISYNVTSAWGKPTEMPQPVTDPYIFSRLLEISTNNTPWDYVNYSEEHYKWAKERSNDPSIPEVRLNPSDETQWAYMGNNNWNDYFLNKASFSHMHSLTFSGGGQMNNRPFSYYLSSDFTKENGLNKLASDYWQRKGIRGRMSFSPLSWLKLDNNMNVYQTNRDMPNTSLTDIYYLRPIDVVKNPDGTWANTGAGRLAAKLVDGGKYNENMFGLHNIFNAVGTFLNGDLTVTADASFKREYWRYPEYSSKYKIGFGPNDIREEGGNGYVQDKRGEVYNDVFNLYANYNKKIDKHAFGATLGVNQEEYIYSTTLAYRDKLMSSTSPYLELTYGDPRVGATYGSYATQSAFGRLNYTFDDKYILEATGRYDGSSRFPKSNRWGFFPSVSGAWIVSNEGFFESLKPSFSNFKVRASYGSLGNQSVRDFDYIQTLATGLSPYLIGGNLVQVIKGAPPLTIDPNTYTWETASTLNLGTDIGFINDKLFLGFDYYVRETSGMLTKGQELPAVLGTGIPKQNAADLKTKGWELSVNYKDQFLLADKPFRFDAKVILSDSKAKITKFQNDQRLLSDYFEGYEFGTIYGLVSDGLFQNAAEISALDESAIVPWGALSIINGWPKFKDLNNDQKIELGLTDKDMKDLKIIGNSSDRLRVGFNLNMDWNGFDGSIFLQGVLKRDFYPRHYLFWGPYQQPYANVYPWHLDFYREKADSPEERAKHSDSYLAAGLADANHDAAYPVLQSWLADVNDGKGLAIPNTQYLLNGAYLRIKNISIGYSLPQHVIERWKLGRVRVFVTGENVFEFSAIKKFVDPEAINNNADNSAWAYPFQRKIAAGINLDF